ncbi:Bug family tripartite tricarboxylate transporter substrate binding protein [Zwartia panacis]|uniref:Bug family tripartite tricarboxylate transporter substrate binding protein n=1 Tax=Zwartia panacis TaxID=2683345 RepID=UPI0025B2BC21|nr:tripartite tricarboxylate transporter substrate binding protein [Zwartia panacis]MDN4016423.1 tripartite tricarboxylate transporter substrate binding protein [Zwartia panacis]
MKKIALKMLITACGLIAATSIHAQSSWQPTSTVEFIVPAGAGAALDTAARQLQNLLAKENIVKNFVITNRPGGNLAVGLNVLDQHPGDGNYLMTLTTSIINNHILGSLNRSYEDYTPIALLFREYVGVVVRADSPIKNGADLIRIMKENPNKLHIGVATSVGNHIHVGIASPLQKAGVAIENLSVIPFKSSGISITQLLGGHIDVVAATTPNLINALKNDKLRIIAIGSPERMGGALSNIPTWKEQGVDVSTSSVQGVMGPKNMTPSQIEFWAKALQKINDSKEWQTFLEQNQWKPFFYGPKETRALLDQEYASIKSVLSKLGLAK